MKKSIGLLLALAVTSVSIVPANAARVKCSDFKSWKEAQAYFDAKKPGYKSLDRDNDGVACEALR